MATSGDSQAIIELRGIVTRFGDRVVHEGLDLDVQPGEVLALVGGSGTGKSTLLWEMTLLHRPSAGTVRLFGQAITRWDDADNLAVRRRMGVLFQQGALFGNLTVLENVAVPLREHTRLTAAVIKDIAHLKLDLAGLTPQDGLLYPSQLSGGMRKRAALARALALDPDVLFLDEPTSGLDPLTADDFDSLVLDLKNALGPTVVMVTHDMDSLWRITDRVMLLGNKRILAQGAMAELATHEDPAVQAFFQGPRARAAKAEYDKERV